MLLSLKEVDVHYGHAKVLHEINLHILKGEVSFIVGRNGAGKTTLLKTIAGLQDREAVRSLGINVDRCFSIVFVLGSCLAALGGVLYAPITTVHPYMGFHILLISFAVVIVGGLGSLKGTTIASFVLGMVMAITGRYWGPAAEAMVFAVMAVVLIFRPIEV